ncbi:MAG: hypothetical protein IJ457_03580 [Clostridia bacterium]|nr:hypothetical protein [Clostridia bacterium]
MFKYSFKRGIFYLPIAVVFFLFTTSAMLDIPLMMPYPSKGFIENTEIASGILCVALCSFILPDKYEIELALICGVRTEKLYLSRVLAVFVYTAVPPYVMQLLYRFKEYDGELINGILPFNAPEGFRLYAALSLFVTLFFFFALFSFFRVVSRNCYIPLILSLCVNTYFTDMNEDIRMTKLPFSRAIADPFISSYLLGEVPEGCSAAQLSLPHLWMWNRIIFFSLGVVFVLLTYILLRRETLHRGYGD